MENTDIDFNNPHIVTMLLLGVLNNLAKTATELDLTGDVKYTYYGGKLKEWEQAIENLQEACQINGYSMVRHIVEVKKGFNVYLLLE